MDQRLEAAILDVLERTGNGAVVDETWLRSAHPQHWREVQEFLEFEARLAGGAPAGDRVGPYVLLRRLGRGGAGTVYLALSDDGASVAVKVLHRDLVARPGFVERTLSEARAAMSPAHPNVVRTLDAGTTSDGAVCYVVTEHVEGQNLRGLLDELGPLREPLVRHIAREILQALVAIHAAGLIHGDLKPENVLVGPDESVKVADLGASPAAPAPGTAFEFRGTILYAAPEQLRGPADGRADLFALGVIVEELIDGEHPLAVAARGRTRPTASGFLRTFAATLRAERPEDRFATAAEALTVLDEGEESPWWRARSADAPRDVAPAAWSVRGAPATQVHGRSREAARLRALMAEATGRAGRAVLVTGEAGVGKTRLLAEFAASARAEGATVLWCPQDVAGPADPLAAALRAAVDAESLDVARHAAAAEALESSLVAWIGSLPGSGQSAPLTASTRPVALGALLRSLAEERPLLVVVDDLHLAADEDSSAFAALAARLRDARVLVVATTRPGHGDACRAMLPHAETLDLANLSVEEVSGMLAEALRSDSAADRLAAEAHRRTAGNPLAVLELLDELRTTDVLVHEENGSWSVRDAAVAPSSPTSARTMLARRIEALPRADRDLLEVAACAGPRFRPGVVARALGRDPGRVLLRLARLERGHRLVRAVGDDAAFDHHEVRDAVLDALSEDHARAHHEALGGAFEAVAGPKGRPSQQSAVIARHFLRAGAGPRAAPHVAPALDWLETADRPTELIELSGAALATPGAVEDAARARVLFLRGACFNMVGRLDEAEDALDESARAAHARGDETLARLADVEASHCLKRQGRFEDALRRARAALDSAVDADDRPAEERARAAVGGFLWYLGRYDESAPHFAREFELARGCGDAVREGEAGAHLGVALTALGRHDEALAAFAAAVERLRTAGRAASQLAGAMHHQATVLGRVGRREEAVRVFTETAKLARSIGLVEAEACALSESGWQLRLLGRVDEALPRLVRGVELLAGGSFPSERSGCVRYVAGHYDWVGRTAESLAAYDEAARLAEAHAFQRGVVLAHVGRALVHAHLDDFDAARSSVAAAVDAAHASGSELAEALVTVYAARWAAEDPSGDAAGFRDAEATLIRLGRGDDVVAPVLADLARRDAEAGRFDEAAAKLTTARALAAAMDLRDFVMICDARLVALGEADAELVAKRLDAEWLTCSVWTRIEAAGHVARKVDAAALIDRARIDVEAAVAGAPLERRDAVRARLTRQIDGAP